MAGLTNEIDLEAWDDEFNNFLRKNLQSVDPNSRITETTQNFTATASQTDYTLTNGTSLSYVDTVTKNASPLTFGTDYSIGWRGANKGKVILTVGADAGDTISVVYGYTGLTNTRKNGDIAYPEFTRTDLGISNLPRVGFVITKTTKPGGWGAGSNYSLVSDVMITIKIVDINVNNIKLFVNTIETAIKQNMRNFYNWRAMFPTGIETPNVSEDTTKSVLAKIISYIIPDRYESVTFA